VLGAASSMRSSEQGGSSEALGESTRHSREQASDAVQEQTVFAGAPLARERRRAGRWDGPDGMASGSISQLCALTATTRSEEPSSNVFGLAPNKEVAPSVASRCSSSEAGGPGGGRPAAGAEVEDHAAQIEAEYTERSVSELGSSRFASHLLPTATSPVGYPGEAGLVARGAVKDAPQTDDAYADESVSEPGHSHLASHPPPITPSSIRSPSGDAAGREEVNDRPQMMEYEYAETPESDRSRSHSASHPLPITPSSVRSPAGGLAGREEVNGCAPMAEHEFADTPELERSGYAEDAVFDRSYSHSASHPLPITTLSVGSPAADGRGERAMQIEGEYKDESVSERSCSPSALQPLPTTASPAEVSHLQGRGSHAQQEASSSPEERIAAGKGKEVADVAEDGIEEFDGEDEDYWEEEEEEEEELEECEEEDMEEEEEEEEGAGAGGLEQKKEREEDNAGSDSAGDSSECSSDGCADLLDALGIE